MEFYASAEIVDTRGVFAAESSPARTYKMITHEKLQTTKLKPILLCPVAVKMKSCEISFQKMPHVIKKELVCQSNVTLF